MIFETLKYTQLRQFLSIDLISRLEKYCELQNR